MNIEAIITLVVLAIMVFFFVTERIPLAVTSVTGALVLASLGIIDKSVVFESMGGSTIVLLAAMMIIGSALFHTGIAETLSIGITKITGTSENGIMIAVVLVALLLSSIASGLGVVAMMLPIVIAMSMKANISVSRQLIPLSFAASVGGNLTLAGAASNVSTAGLIEDMGISFISFFEIGKVGIPIAILFLIYFLTIGKKALTKGDTSNHDYLEEYTHKSSESNVFSPAKAIIAGVILVAVLIAMAINHDSFPMYFVAAVGAILLILTRCMSEKDAIKSIDWPTLFIVGGMSAVSKAMTDSGAGTLIADGVVQVLGEEPNKLLFLFLVLVITMLLTNMMMNTSTVLLVTPLLIPIAVTIDVNPVAIGIAICVAASAPFLTPVGSGTNTLIIKPGNLSFRDFFIPGIGLSAVVLVGSMMLIPLFWPL
ncbi:SLC13 family permease [Oceanobacillus jeddahense]|uniref:SLC13 family permease n=1 Tax=Oceanobacillus jeddahense TaxID=1462527 RepID=UPI000595C62F|nr:SLC13 family permease [Oceanobacillus jeddahense]